MDHGPCTTEVLIVEHGTLRRFVEMYLQNVDTGVPGTLAFYIVNHIFASCSLSGKNRIFGAIAAWPGQIGGIGVSRQIENGSGKGPRDPLRYNMGRERDGRRPIMGQALECVRFYLLTMFTFRFILRSSTTGDGHGTSICHKRIFCNCAFALVYPCTCRPNHSQSKIIRKPQPKQTRPSAGFFIAGSHAPNATLLCIKSVYNLRVLFYGWTRWRNGAPYGPEKEDRTCQTKPP